MSRSLFHQHICIVPFGTPLYDTTVDLRNRVLRIPLNLSFTTAQLSTEWQQTHIAYLDMGNSSVIGVLVMKELGGNSVKMRQVAVEPRVQGQSIGTQLVQYAEQWARQKKFDNIVLAARAIAVPFYKKLGYRIHGNAFIEVGIRHYEMRKEWQL